MIGVQEYAVQTGKSVWQVYRDLKAGNIHGAYRNGTWKIPEDSVKKLLSQYSLLPPPPKGSVEWYDDRFYLTNIPTMDIETRLLERCLHHPRLTAWTEPGPNGEALRAFLPSVTTYLEIINKPFLGTWRGDIGNREADRKMHEAGDRGSRIHRACECISQGGYVVFDSTDRPRYTPAELGAMSNNTFVLHDQMEYHAATKWTRWLEAVNPGIIALEAQVFSLEHEYAGTLDMLCDIRPGSYAVNGSTPVLLGGRYIVDLKTGKSIHDEHWMQMAAYRNAVEEDGGKVDGAIIVHTSAMTKKGIEGLASHIRTAAELEKDFSDFKAAQKLWMRQNESMKPKIMQLPDFLTYQPE